MAKRVVLHIGTGKTGTSSIQNFVHQHREALRDRKALDYPDVGLAHEEHYGELIHAHYTAVYWVLSENASGLRQVRKAIDASKCGTVLLSCENFYHLLSPEQVGTLAALLKGLSVRIVCYVRRQDLYIESAWKQQAKVGALRMPFPAFLEQHTSADYLSKSHANYHAKLEPWREAFGREAIVVRPFDASAFRAGDLVTDFLDACGLDDVEAIAALPRAPSTNVAIPSELADLVRRTNVEKLVDPEHQQAYVAWLRGFGGFEDPPLLTSKDRRAILRNYRDANRKLFEDYLGGRSPALFLPAATRGEDPPETAPKVGRAPDPAIRCLVEAWRKQSGTKASRPRAASASAARAWPPTDLRGPLPYPPTFGARAVADLVREHQRLGKPLSVVRLGDGEATLIGYPDHVPEEALGTFTRTWFGRHQPDRAQRLELAERVRESIRHADVIGVTRGDEVDRFTVVRHLLSVYGLVAEGAKIGRATLHRNLQERDLFTELLTGLDEVGIVTCRNVAPLLEQAFSIGRVTTYLVPEEMEHATHPETVGRHFPDRFEELRRTLAVPRPGTLFLVGAGPCGKVYCQWIKERGGVALDIGSVFDGWDGRLTRRYIRTMQADGTATLDERYRLQGA